MGRVDASYRELWRLLEAGVLLALEKVRQMPVEVVQKIHLQTSIGSSLSAQITILVAQVC